MRTLRIDVSDTIYEHIIFFLKSLPKNLIHISTEEEAHNHQHHNSTKSQVEKLFDEHNIKAFQNIQDPVAWQKSIRDEWE